MEEFAAYLGVSRPLLNMWMNGQRKPGGENVRLLSYVYGEEVYDVLDLPRPNPYLQAINRAWEKLSPEHQRKLAEDAEEYRLKNERPEKTSPKRKTSTHP